MTPEVLETINLECVRGNRRLFKGISFSVQPGEFVQLTGANGSGKTSLLRMLCGLLPPASGEIRWQGVNISMLGGKYSSVVTYVGHRHAVKDELTALENLRVASGLSGFAVTRKAALDVLARVGLAGREHLPARLLSEGQRRRLALTRLVVCPTPVWLLDEVFTSLDRAAVDSTRSLISGHLKNGGMAIVATHQEFELPAAGGFRRIELAS